jgi:hypothetical protein
MREKKLGRNPGFPAGYSSSLPRLIPDLGAIRAELSFADAHSLGKPPGFVQRRESLGYPVQAPN